MLIQIELYHRVENDKFDDDMRGLIKVSTKSFHLNGTSELLLAWRAFYL